MYCVNCGVKLADTEKVCPLCGVTAYHPELVRGEGEPLYPERQPAPQVKSQVAQVVYTVLLLLPALVCWLCDRQISGMVTWSGYVIGALGLLYVALVLPAWFRKPNPVIFVPCAFVAVGLYLLYISLATGGGWFLSFAFPITGGVALIVTAVVTLLKYVRRGQLYIFGGAIIALGGMTVLAEFLSVITFGLDRFFGWSFYPLMVAALLGGLLIFLAICRPARETMERKIFL